MLGELAEIVFLLEGLSEKPAIAVHDNVVNGLMAHRCFPQSRRSRN
jgi:hypothetical protein